MNRRGESHAISVIIMTAAIVVIVIVASAYIAQALTNSSANLEFQTQQKTTIAVGDIINSLAFKKYATDGIQMNLRFGDEELFSSTGFTITITYNDTKTLTFALSPSYNFSYIQTTGWISIPGASFLSGNGSLFATPGSSLINIVQWKSGKVAYISTLPRIQYTTQDITFYNGSKATYLYLNYVRFNTTSVMTHQSFLSIFNFRLQASDLSVQTWKLVTKSFTVSANNCPTQFLTSCNFSATLSAARPVVVVLSTSTITISKT